MAADKKSLLLVDSDEKSLRVLEVSLKKAGFNVTTARNGREGLERVETANPDLIISDTKMEELDGFEFRRRLKLKPEWADVPFIFLTEQSAIQDKIKGLELGVEDYLTKPIYIKEILTRVKILLQKREQTLLDAVRAGQTKFAGTLADMTVVDLIQTLEIGRKSGIVHFTGSHKRRASVFFRNGKVIDAEVGRLQGADAMYRLLTWPDGKFEVEFKNVRRKDAIEVSSQGLLMEGMRRLDEWGRMTEQLPPLTTIFEVDYAQLSERLAEIPDDVNGVLRLFDGRRTLMNVVDDSQFSDLEALSLVAKLFFEGLIFESKAKADDEEAESPAVQYDAIQDWLEKEGSIRKLPASTLSGMDGGGTAPAVSKSVIDQVAAASGETLVPSATPAPIVEPAPTAAAAAAEEGGDFDENEFADERRPTPSGEMAAQMPGPGMGSSPRAPAIDLSASASDDATTNVADRATLAAPPEEDSEDLPLESGMFRAIVDGGSAVAEATLLPPPQRRRNTLRGLRLDQPLDSLGLSTGSSDATPQPRGESNSERVLDEFGRARSEGSAVARIATKKMLVRKSTEDPARPAELRPTGVGVSGRRAGEDSFEDETPIPPPFIEEPSSPHRDPLQLRTGSAPGAPGSTIAEDSGDEEFDEEEVTSAQITEQDVISARELGAASAVMAKPKEAESVDEDALTPAPMQRLQPPAGGAAPVPQTPRPYMLSSAPPTNGIPNSSVAVAGAFDSAAAQRAAAESAATPAPTRVPTIELAPGTPQGKLTAQQEAVVPVDDPRAVEGHRMRRISGEDAFSRPVSARVVRMRAAAGGDAGAGAGGGKGKWIALAIVGAGIAIGASLFASRARPVATEPETEVTVGQPSATTDAPEMDAAVAVAPEMDAAVAVAPAVDAAVAVAAPEPTPEPKKPEPEPEPKKPQPEPAIAKPEPKKPEPRKPEPAIAKPEPKKPEPRTAEPDDKDKDKGDARALLDKARRASRDGKKDQALKYVDQVLAISPRNADALALKANVLLDLGRSAEALNIANKALEVDPGNADVWLAKGLVHYDRGQNPQAKKAFEKYLELRPKGREADAVRTILDSL